MLFSEYNGIKMVSLSKLTKDVFPCVIADEVELLIGLPRLRSTEMATLTKFRSISEM